MRKKICSIIIAMALVVTSVAPCDYSKASASNVRTEKIESALQWIAGKQNDDGSWGKGTTELDTYEILYMYENYVGVEFNSSGFRKAVSWAESKNENNNDYLARKEIVKKLYNENDMAKLISTQKNDGGFGISSIYQSDILDTVLVLNTMLEMQEIDREVVDNALAYVLSRQNENGSYQYENVESESVFLTSEVLLVVAKYIEKYGINMGSYNCKERATEYLINIDNAEENDDISAVEKIQRYRALMKVNGYASMEETELDIYSLQNANGSISNDEYATALFVEALEERENVPTGSISKIALYSGEDENDCFHAFEEVKYKVLGDWDQNIEVGIYILDESGNVVYQSGNENGGWCVEGIAHGTYEMHAQLLDKKFRNVITETQRNIYILPTVNVENMETFLSSDAVVIGAEKQVSVNGYFAYKGNIDENVKIKTTVSKNGEIFDENEIECRVNSDKEECEINLINFVPDTTEVATYKIKSSLVYGENEISSCEKQFHVLAKEPNTTVEYSQGLNKEVLLPGNDFVSAEFKLTGRKLEESAMRVAQMRFADEMMRATALTTASENEEEIFAYSGSVLSNQYIGLVSTGGNYSVGTIEGDPNSTKDNNQRLIYGHPGGSTSYTTVNLDNNTWKYNPNIINCNVDTQNGSITSEQLYGNVRIRQVATIVENSISGRKDIVQMKYIVKNEDEISHQLGMRIMLDTMLGSNDSAPFRVPGFGGVTTEKELKGEEIPQYYQVFNSLDNPSVVAHGTLYLSEEERPDRVQFVNWRKASNNMWNCSVSNNSSIGDSAVNVYWDPKTLEAGETMEFVTYYGCGELNSASNGGLVTGFTGATKLDVLNDEYNPNPFLATAYAYNMGNSALENVEGRIVLPEGLSLAEGETEVKSFGTLLANGEAQNSWNIVAEPSEIDVTLTYSVVFSVNGIEVKTINRQVELPQLDINIAAKNVVLETNIDANNFRINREKSVPEISEIIENENGTTTLKWKLSKLMIDETKGFELAVDGTDLPNGKEVIVTKNTKLSYTDKYGNENKVKLPNMSLPVSKYSVVSKLSTDEDTYESYDIVEITEETENLRDFETSLKGTVAIYDENDNLVEIVAENVGYTWEPSQKHEFTYNWDTFEFEDGEYTIKSTWSDDEQVVVETSTKFKLFGDGYVSNTMTLDKEEYSKDEIVTITNSVMNNYSNKVIDSLELIAEVYDANGIKIWDESEKIYSLCANSRRQLKEKFNPCDCVAGTYKAKVSIYQDGEIVSVQEKSFVIKSVKETLVDVSGSISLDKNIITPVEKLQIATNVANHSNEDLAGLKTKVSIVKETNKEVVYAENSTVDILSGSSVSGTIDFEAASLEEGNYFVVYDAMTSENTTIQLATSKFTVYYIKDNFETDTDEWNFMGSAYRSSNGYAVLTKNKNAQVGAMWLKRGINKPFVTSFKYKLGGGTGADGFVFMFGKKPNTLGNSGRELGFKVGNGYGVEFDSFYNEFHGEHCGVNTRHIALIKDKLSSGTAGKVLTPLAVNLEPKYAKLIRDNKWHDVEVRVTTEGVDVYVDGGHAVQYTGEISFDYDGFGFAGSTGTSNDNQYIDDVVIRENTVIERTDIKDDFEKDSMQWTYMGSAKLNDNGYVQLTGEEKNVSGAIWLDQVVSGSYDASFKYKAGGSSSSLGEGFVFMFGKERYELGNYGSSLGFASGNGYGVEFDSYSNKSHGEHTSSGKHIAIIKKKTTSSSSEKLSSLALYKDAAGIVNDRKWHDVIVKVRSTGVDVFVDDKKILSWKGTKSNNYSGIGFAASTGSGKQYHYIDDVEIIRKK